VVGIWLGIQTLHGLASFFGFMETWGGWDLRIVGLYVLMGALALLCIRGPERVARLCRWPDTEPLAGAAVPPESWMRAGEVAVGWLAIVLLVDPLARVVWILTQEGSLGEALWDRRGSALTVLLLGGVAAWLLRRRATVLREPA
jgi:hypothetical protein